LNESSGLHGLGLVIRRFRVQIPRGALRGLIPAAQITTPVFGVGGDVSYSFMILGPGFDLLPEESTVFGSRILTAADEATTILRRNRG
jgi:hypothetical protein